MRRAALIAVVLGNGLPHLPSGFAFLIDSNGAYLVDSNGAYLIAEAS